MLFLLSDRLSIVSGYIVTHADIISHMYLHCLTFTKQEMHDSFVCTFKVTLGCKEAGCLLILGEFEA